MYRLLIADDEESIREGVSDFVRQNCPEWDVAALARDGREALALAREILPDAVLTDITMPHMNGLEFLESLSDLQPEAKLLVLSGYDQFEYAVQALRLGVSDYLLKPLDTAKLVSALSRFAAELDAQALRWAQIETLRTNTQKTNELELQSYFRAALLGEELPALSAANAVFAQEGTSYCCVCVTVAQAFFTGAGTTALWRGAYWRCSVFGTRPGRRWCSVRPARHAQGCFSR